MHVQKKLEKNFKHITSNREVGARRNEWNKSRKNQKIFLRKKFMVLINSFNFLDMFRNLSSVIFRKLEVHCFISHLRINKNPRVFDVCFEKKSGTENFRQVTSLKWLSLLIWSIPANEILHGDSQCIVLSISHVKRIGGITTLVTEQI